MSKTPMLKGGFVGDIHSSSHNPSGRIDDYSETCLRKLEEVNSIAKERNWDFTVYLGDISNTANTSIPYINNLIDVIKGNSSRRFAVAGNHDLSHRRVDDRGETIFGLFLKAGAFEDLEQLGTLFINSSSHSTTLTGLHFRTKPWESLPRIQPEPYTYNFLLCHQFLSGQQRQEETLSLEEIAEAGYTHVIAGHEHADHGVEEFAVTSNLSNKLKVYRFGSLTRKENADFNLERIPRVLEIDFATGEETFIEVSCEPAEKVFRRKRESLDDAETFDSDKILEFAKSVDGGGFLGDTAEVNLLDKLVTERGLKRDSEVFKCVSGYFERNGLR